MNTFEKNILNIYRDEGKLWLIDLPKQIDQLTVQWNLRDLSPLNGLTYNYVLSGFQEGMPIILKLSLRQKDLDMEACALEAFKGFGAISILKKEKNALLLQQAIPGNSLKNNPEKNGKKNIEIACNVAKKLHTAPFSKKHNFPPITDWLCALDKEWAIPLNLLKKARAIKEQLLKISKETPILLHGDLHQENIISHGNEWLVIDPKGVMGFPINELWACVEDPEHDLKFISQFFGLSFNEVINWYYVHVVLAACWQVEDNLDPAFFLNLANSIYLNVKSLR